MGFGNTPLGAPWGCTLIISWGPLSPVRTNQCNWLGFCCSFKREDESGSPACQRPRLPEMADPSHRERIPSSFLWEGTGRGPAGPEPQCSSLTSTACTHAHTGPVNISRRLISVTEKKTGRRGSGKGPAPHPAHRRLQNICVSGCLPQASG